MKTDMKCPSFPWLRLGLQIATNELDLARERYAVITAASYRGLVDKERLINYIPLPSTIWKHQDDVI